MSVATRTPALPGLAGLARTLSTEFPDMPLETVAMALVRAGTLVADRFDEDRDVAMAEVEWAARADLAAVQEDVAPVAALAG